MQVGMKRGWHRALSIIRGFWQNLTFDSAAASQIAWNMAQAVSVPSTVCTVAAAALRLVPRAMAAGPVRHKKFF